MARPLALAHKTSLSVCLCSSAVVAAATLGVSTLHAAPASINLSGTGAEGYFAVVGLNQEAGTTLDSISRDPGDAKFFDYPAYVNPDIPGNIYIMYVEPYQFGLAYPNPLHPDGPSSFDPVGGTPVLDENNQVVATIPLPAGTPGATFIEGVTEDADFADFDIGSITYDDSLLTGVGTEIIGIDDITLTLDGSDFQSQNRTKLNQADTGFDPSDPIGTVNPEGRSNRNEASNVVTITPSNFSGTGLTFEHGILRSIDLTADVAVNSTPGATEQTTPNPVLGFDASGTLTFSGFDFAFDVDGLDSTLFASNVRVLLNRSGTLPIPGDFDFDGDVDADDIDLLAAASPDTVPPGNSIFDLTGDDIIDFLVDGSSDSDKLIRAILGTEYGDADLNGEVNIVDLGILATSFGGAGGWANGDFNGDGLVNIVDLGVLATSFGFSATLAAELDDLLADGDIDGGLALAASRIPEPASIGVLTVIAPIVALRRRRLANPI